MGTIFYFVAIQIWYLVFPGSRSSYIDEIFSIVLLYPAILCIRKYREYRFATILLIIYIALSVAGNLYYSYGGSHQPQAGIIDIFGDLKLYIFTSSIFYLIRESINPKKFWRSFVIFIIILSLINSIFVVRDIMISGGLSILGNPLDIRLGIIQPQGLQFHKIRSAELTFLGFAFALYVALRSNRKQAQVTYYAASFWLLVVFLRHVSAKETVALLVLLPLIIPGGRLRGLLLPMATSAAYGLGLVLLFFTPLADVTLSRFNFFYGQDAEDTARSAIFLTSFDIANDHFPLGSGAGTYASGPSFQMGYSTVYDKYGLAGLWGASLDNPWFLQDGSWAKIIGQSGWLGALFYTWSLLLLCMPVTRLYLRSTTYAALPAVSSFVLALLVSTGSSPFSDEFMCAILAICSAYCAYQLPFQQKRSRWRFPRTKLHNSELKSA